MSDHSQKQANDNVDFGYQTVPKAEKRHRVGAVFDSVARRYDVMNDLMSFGIHRLWKRFAVELAGVRPGQKVLDLAGGTGDLAAHMARRLGDKGRLVLSDINASMLEQGRRRLADRGLAGYIDYVLSDAQSLPFADDTFHCITIAFGLRNVTDKAAALQSMYRVLRPGGRLLVLEFSKPTLPALSRLYDQYSFRVLPIIGRLVAGDSDSYRYLAESIRMHPNQETLREMMEAAGYERCQFYNLTGGIVAVHRGYKL